MQAPDRFLQKRSIGNDVTLFKNKNGRNNYRNIANFTKDRNQNVTKEIISIPIQLTIRIDARRGIYPVIQVHVIIFDTPPSLFTITSIIDMNNSVNNDITLRYYKYKHYRYRCFNTPYTNPLPPIMLVLYMAYYQSTNLEPPHQYPTTPPSIAFITSV